MLVFSPYRANFKPPLEAVVLTLSCDMMEPFRVLVDRKVKGADYGSFGTDEKHDIISILNDTVEIDGVKQNVLNAIKIYCRSVFEALNDGDASEIKFYRI